MKALAITHKGIEDIASKEIKEIIGADSKPEESCIIFEPNSLVDLCKLCYSAQSIAKVSLLLKNFRFKDFKEIKKKIRDLQLNEWIDKDTSFVVRCKRIGEHKFSSQEVEATIGELIVNKEKARVSLEDPDTTFFIYIYNGNCYFGIDFSGYDLSKRDYKIFSHSLSLKGTVAYALVRIADYKVGEVLLDPFVYDGTIPIEAALFISKFSPHYYNKQKFAFRKLKQLQDIKFDILFEKIDKESCLDKNSFVYAYSNNFKYIDYSKKNSKIAGINKQINFSKIDVEWLDTKFDKGSVDKVVTLVPQLLRNTSSKEIEKLYREFFYQLEFVLKKDGKVVVITRSAIKLLTREAEKNKFKVAERRQIMQGKEVFDVLVFQKL
jgi:putative N6-adenine-specific DNA methylase